MDAVGGRFAVRVREVAEKYDGTALVGVGDDACTCKACLAESSRRDLRAHEAGCVQLPAEGGACTETVGERVVAYDVEHSGGDDLLVLEFPVRQNHLDELEEVGDAAEHAGASDGEQLLQHPGAFVVDFALDFAVAELAKFCGCDF